MNVVKTKIDETVVMPQLRAFIGYVPHACACSAHCMFAHHNTTLYITSSYISCWEKQIYSSTFREDFMKFMRMYERFDVLCVLYAVSMPRYIWYIIQNNTLHNIHIRIVMMRQRLYILKCREVDAVPKHTYVYTQSV